jgi:hypothetical protein
MRSVLLAVLIFAPAFAGCSDPPNIGALCTVAKGGCDKGLTCDESVTGGYCTSACTTVGSRSECPEGAVCDSLSGGAPSCINVCTVQTDCRPDLECNGVSGSDVKACKMKTK